MTQNPETWEILRRGTVKHICFALLIGWPPAVV